MYLFLQFLSAIQTTLLFKDYNKIQNVQIICNKSLYIYILQEQLFFNKFATIKETIKRIVLYEINDSSRTSYYRMNICSNECLLKRFRMVSFDIQSPFCLQIALIWLVGRILSCDISLYWDSMVVKVQTVLKSEPRVYGIPQLMFLFVGINHDIFKSLGVNTTTIC